MRGAIHPLPQYAFMAWCLVIGKHRNSFILTFYGVSYIHIATVNMCLQEMNIKKAEEVHKIAYCFMG
jgi:hypothetical protein